MPYRNCNDETLVMLTLAGKTGAYEALVLRHQKAVIIAASAVTHVTFMAEDAAQDAFITAWMKLDALREPSKFGAWVCRIARNCAKNMVMRYHGFLSLDALETYAASECMTPDEEHEEKEEFEEMRRSIGHLPERVREIVRLHYFEDLSVGEIAGRLQITEGTVKSQLHDGRKRMRRELCAMNEKWSDTLLQKVMKKVAELKLWRVKNKKDGFEKVYREVLRDVEDLPESSQKQHALADMLMHGWWWLPGEKNDALFARIKNAAEQGHNDEVMEFIVTREDSKVREEERISHIRDQQIPYLQKHGFICALAREWFWLGYECCRAGDADAGMKAYEQAKKLLTPANIYYALAADSAWLERHIDLCKEKSESRYLIAIDADEFRNTDGVLRYWKTERCGEGYLLSLNRRLLSPYRESALCDGQFMASTNVGEIITGSDGTTLTLLADNVMTETPAGCFKGCQVWETNHWDRHYGIFHIKTYYAPSVGIVKVEETSGDITDTLLLTAYNCQGAGYLPMQQGNSWQYALSDDPAYLHTEVTVEVVHADSSGAILATRKYAERHAYDETSWKDAVQEVRCEYWKDDGYRHRIQDVLPAVLRAERLAKTPMEKAHTAYAAATARRIMETDTSFHPSYVAEGCWNFFNKRQIHKQNGKVNWTGQHRWSFEWKNCIEGSDPLCCNMIYSILEDAGQYLWNDEWQIGAETLVEYTLHDAPLKIQIQCTDAGTLTTKAGTFDNCMCITFDIFGMGASFRYRGGKKKYWFADGIGVVKTWNELAEGALEAVYELTYYKGTGEGYMPFEDGMVRRYEAVGLTDGFYGAANYTYLADTYGDIVVFSEKIGIKNVPTVPITQYSTILGETIEESLWGEKKRDESRLRHDINQLNILLHFLCRYNRAWGVAERGAACYLRNLAVLETFAEKGELPSAWLGLYAGNLLRAGCALCGAGRSEEGYLHLERAIEFFRKFMEIPAGTDLSFGNKHLFGGVKYRKEKEYIVLPSGKRELLSYSHMLDQNLSTMYHAMTAKRGWEWFNSVREEKRFQELLACIRALLKK